MKAAFHPLLLYPCIIRKDNTTFRLPRADVEVGIPSSLAKKLVTFADGTHTTEWLLKNIGGGWSERSIAHLIATLKDSDVLVDGRNISPVMWQFMSNPSPVSPELTEGEIQTLVLDTTLQRDARPVAYTLKTRAFDDALESRSSTRLFGRKSIPIKSLETILWSAYGLIKSTFSMAGEHVHRRTVPSAGALYPIMIHMVLFTASGKVRSGAYRVTSTQPGTVALHQVQDDAGLFKPCFVDRSAVRNAAGVIVISGAMDRSTAKYANRGILYTILEAGHVAQNALRATQEEGLAAVEIGGFFEKRVRNVLELPPNCEPLTTIVFGSRAEPDSTTRAKRIDLDGDLVSHLEVMPRRVRGYTTPFVMVFAEVNDAGDPWWSCGRADDLELAKTKAVAEAVEWHACGMVDTVTLTVASYTDIKDHAIDPLDMARYLPAQFNATTKLRPFRPKAPYAWHEVTDLQTAEKRLVLADFIFFPYTPDNGERYAFANSSGCACHTTVERAIQNALLELVEREAFMVTWLNRLTRPKIASRSLPSPMQRRLKSLREAGFDTTVVDITYDLTPVPFVMSVNADFSFATCSAASGFAIEESLDKALMEVEASVYCRLKDGPALMNISPEDVKGPEDHALLYESKRHIHRLDFLHGNAEEPVTLKSVSERSRIKSIDDLLAAFVRRQLTPYITELDSGQRAVHGQHFRVVRAIVPGMVPATFGYDLTSLGLPRVRSLPTTIGKRGKPLTRLNRFPHPFG